MRTGWGISGVLAVGLALSPALAAKAEEKRVWIGERQEDGATLVYGIPQSDDVPIAFSCQLPARTLVINLSLGETNRQKSGRVTLALSAPPLTDKLTFSADAHFLEEMGVTMLEAHGRYSVALARLLRQGRELRVAVGQELQTFPLAGASRAMTALEAACAESR